MHQGNKFHCFCSLSLSVYHCFSADIDDCDPRNDIFSQEGEGSWTEFGYCGQHGTCVDGVNSYSCRCDPGWNGTKCEIGMLGMLECVFRV